LERYLVHAKLLTGGELVRLREQSLACAQTAFEEVEREPDEVVEDTFRYHYLEMPDIMEAQLERRKS
jgi:TPP-dependent pyruvate/acetoin dehydrogenase alpha subunit